MLHSIYILFTLHFTENMLLYLELRRSGPSAAPRTHMGSPVWAASNHFTATSPGTKREKKDYHKLRKKIRLDCACEQRTQSCHDKCICRSGHLSCNTRHTNKAIIYKGFGSTKQTFTDGPDSNTVLRLQPDSPSMLVGMPSIVCNRSCTSLYLCITYASSSSSTNFTSALESGVTFCTTMHNNT